MCSIPYKLGSSTLVKKNMGSTSSYMVSIKRNKTLETYVLLIKTHGRVSAAKKDARAQVCYLRDRSSSRFQPLITQKVLRLFPPNL